MSTTIYVLIRKMKKKTSEFLSENFQFLVVKISVYLNRHVFIMLCKVLDGFHISIAPLRDQF